MDEGVEVQEAASSVVESLMTKNSGFFTRSFTDLVDFRAMLRNDLSLWLNVLTLSR
jgi:hypothetical protein